jgi:hypothetical protein
MAVQYELARITWPAPGVTGTVTATITAPDATIQTIAATSGDLQAFGVWTAWFTPELIGTYTIVWAATGGQTLTATLTVTAPPAPTQVMSIADCYASLKMPANLIGADPVRDADMLAYAGAATAVVEGIVGPISPVTITEVFDGGRDAILLRARPTAIVSVIVSGVAAYSWIPDFLSGILYAPPIGFAPGIRNVVITYTTGTGHAGPNVHLGIREVFRQLWERSRALGGAASSDMVMQGFAIPNAVYELLAASTDVMPGFA